MKHLNIILETEFAISFLDVAFVFHLCYLESKQQVLSQVSVHTNVNNGTEHSIGNHWPVDRVRVR